MESKSTSLANDQEKLPRKLGLLGLWLLVVNGFVGAGIFGLPGGIYKLAGDYSVLIYLVCALLILPVILSFAELGSYFRGTGGPVKYVTEAFGPFTGFQAGWLFYMSQLIAFSANSVLLTDSISYFFEPAGQGSGRLITLALIIGTVTLINVLSSVKSIWSLAFFTILKFSALLFLIFGGLVMLGSKVTPSFETTVPPVTDLGAATLLLLYAFVGFEGAVIPAGEAKKPKRDVPISLLLGLGSVVILYIFIQLVTQSAVPDLANSTSPLLDAAGEIFGTTGTILLMIGLVASVAGNLVSTIFSTPRLSYVLSIQNTLPAWFGKVNSKFQTPANSIIFFGIFAFTGAIFGTFIELAAMTVLSRVFLFIISCATIPILRPRFRNKARFILKGGYIIPSLGILSCLWLLFQVNLYSILLTILFIAVGTGLYWIGKTSDTSQTI